MYHSDILVVYVTTEHILGENTEHSVSKDDKYIRNAVRHRIARDRGRDGFKQARCRLRRCSTVNTMMIDHGGALCKTSAAPAAPLNQIKILSHKEKSGWTLEAKYNIGKK